MGASSRRFWRLAVAVKYNVAQLLKAAVGESRQYELSEDISGIDPSLDVAGPLVGRVRFLRTSEGVLVTGRLHVEVRASCRRCLQDLVLPVEVHLEEEYRPSVDVFFSSVAEFWPETFVAVMLTGMGNDGATGLMALRQAGWRTLVQDEATSVVYGMPKAAVDIGSAERMLPLKGIW